MSSPLLLFSHFLDLFLLSSHPVEIGLAIKSPKLHYYRQLSRYSSFCMKPVKIPAIPLTNIDRPPHEELLPQSPLFFVFLQYPSFALQWLRHQGALPPSMSRPCPYQCFLWEQQQSIISWEDGLAKGENYVLSWLFPLSFGDAFCAKIMTGIIKKWIYSH